MAKTKKVYAPSTGELCRSCQKYTEPCSCPDGDERRASLDDSIVRKGAGLRTSGSASSPRKAAPPVIPVAQVKGLDQIAGEVATRVVAAFPTAVVHAVASAAAKAARLARNR